MNTTLLNLLESIFGKSKLFRGDESYHRCPFCNHHKKKLAINLSNQAWHCWVCDAKGKTLYSLFKKNNCSSEQIKELNSITGKKVYKKKTDDSEEKIVELPKEFLPMWRKSKNLDYRRALMFLQKRGLTSKDILKYGIGYCSEGLYEGRVIVPSYDKEGKLNYFVGRSVYNDGFKYKNPPVSKDIVGFELFINWNYPIVIVEGVFDAMSVKRNAIPIFGKTIPKSLKREIVKQRVKDIYISLDRDARKDAIKLTEELLREGINVYFIDLPDKDPSELGFEKFTNMMMSVEPLRFSNLMQLKLGI